MPAWTPALALVEPGALEYPLGRRLAARLRADGVPLEPLPPGGGRGTLLPFSRAKRTLVVAVRRTLRFRPCPPSADYQLPLATGCPALCQYCYLHGIPHDPGWVRVYVNLEEILSEAARVIALRAPSPTSFEAAAAADPVAVEPLTGALSQAVEFFGAEPWGRLRFATKFPPPGGLLCARHRGRTRARVSLNAKTPLQRFEPGAPGLAARFEALAAFRDAEYPVGVLIAPVMVFPGWEEEYRRLLRDLAHRLHGARDLTFEVITFRFTGLSRRIIEARFPSSGLDLGQEGRAVRRGPGGRAKYVYSPERMEGVRRLFERLVSGLFPGGRLEYVI
ncbi:MAG: hypothetical protein K6T75_04475 [Acetobacteraceae bacterium]|nr:hypothetical protein [Acetobacteraceae bacterium]